MIESRRREVFGKGFAAIGLVVVMLPGCLPKGPAADAGRELQELMSGLVENDKSVKNAVLAVAKGDGSFSWAGAAGIAHGDGQVAMTPETPFYTASVTKLYTAAVIMRLYEAEALSLHDPVAKYLPADLIKGIAVYRGRDYSGELTIEQLLGKIIEAVTGKPLEVVYQELLFALLGLRHTRLVGHWEDTFAPPRSFRGCVRRAEEHHEDPLSSIVLG